MSATLQDYLSAATALEQDGLGAIRSAASLEQLDAARNDLLGRKSGRLTELMRQLPALDQSARRDAGAAANRVKERLEQALESRRGELDRSPATTSLHDPSMPARHQWIGAKHAVTQIIEEIGDIFREIGFTIAVGPEAETEWYNFLSLNFPADHPAMDAHDTLYLEGGVLLRTHTSPVQTRTLQAYRPPIRVLIPGTCYRRDFFDPSHAPAFVQIEGLAIDEGITFVDFKATLSYFANRIYGRTKTRFRPSYFPFTEPSAEMDVQCRICRGGGCSSCKQTGWIEILGSGMVHPAVLEACDVDSERYTGWAFGMGPARIAIARYGIPDIRLFYDSDIRFLERFA